MRVLLFSPQVKLSISFDLDCFEPLLHDNSILEVSMLSEFLLDLSTALNDSLKVLNHFNVS